MFCLTSDIDECANDDNDCDTNALCTNTEGSYICRCLKGYEGDGRICVGMCHLLYRVFRYICHFIKHHILQQTVVTQMLCVPTLNGSFVFRCLKGYGRDGRNCTGKIDKLRTSFP